MKIIGWIKVAEQWVYRKCDEHPAWNALTWAGHAAAVVLVAGVFGVLGGWIDVLVAFLTGLFGGVQTNLAVGWAMLAATSVASYYLWREAVEVYRGQHAKGGKVWAAVDHILDVLAPIIAAFWV